MEDDKRIRIAEREAHAKRHNAERVQDRYLLFTQSYSLQRQSKWPVCFFNRFQATGSNPGIPVKIANKALAGSVAPSVICRESVPSALPEPPLSKMLFKLPEQIPARLLYVNAPSQFFGKLSSSVSELLSTDQGAISTVYQPDIFLEFGTRLEDKSIDNFFLAFYKQSLYEQGTARCSCS